MYKNPKFKKRLIASVVASTALAGFSGSALAQSENIEEVVVTGIRASLERSMDTKRNAPGVVDAITAEDIGKFPDTNLAESLQRITGVSIDRRNGEGSQVTIRGFGGGNNLVLLNGRHMPAGGVFGGGSGAGGTFGGATRSFDFANLASESVGGIEVYKTGRADIATGGIGGTINILTNKPLDNPGLKASIGAKAVFDTTNEHGDDVTPEVSGLFSWTDDSERFGVSLTGSYQERDSAQAGFAANDWNIAQWGVGNNMYSMAPGGVVENAPAQGQLYARPNDIRYSFSDRHRERTNAQLTLQFRPVDNITLTGDYTYAENYLQENRHEQTLWFANGSSVTRVVFDDGAIASPLLIAESLSNKDHGFEQQWREQTDTLESFGFNVDWQVTDSFKLALDVHDSSLESLPSGPGNAGEIAISLAAPILTSQTIEFGSGLPRVTGLTFDDNRERFDSDGNSLGFNGNRNGIYDAGDFGYQVARIFYAAQTTDVTQIKLDGSFELDDGRFDFGVDTRAMETVQQNSDRYMALGDWGVANPGEIAPGLLEDFDFTQYYDDYNMSGSSRLGVRAPDVVALAQHAINLYATPSNGYVLNYQPNFATHNIIEEDTVSAYVQFATSGELGNMPTNLLLGLRYETTDVTSTSYLLIPEHLRWLDNNDFQLIRSSTVEPFSVDFSYDNLLPSVDFDISLTDDIKARMSYSKTIARAGYGSLAASVGGFGTVGSTLLGSQPVATASNPRLLPLESDNVDLSLEWYYDDSSYAAVGFFEKRVRNFIGTEQVDETHFGMRDVTNGPRVQAARAALEGLGVSVDDTSLFAMAAILDNPQDFPTGAAAFQFDPATGLADADFVVNIATAYDLNPNANDPLMVFRTSKPVNNREAKIYGAEFAVQHFFGDSGFGVQANYTIVRGDVKFDDLALPSEAQFALTGLSDTANLVAIYENYGFQARLAYNWRDKFLNQTNRGNSRNPTYVEAYGQIDLNVSYQINDNIQVFAEGLNLNGENVRHYNRSVNQPWFAEELGARYNIGARYTF